MNCLATVTKKNASHIITTTNIHYGVIKKKASTLYLNNGIIITFFYIYLLKVRKPSLLTLLDSVCKRLR